MNIIIKAIRFLQLHGLSGLFFALLGRVRGLRAKGFVSYSGLLAEKNGIEIGGPSRVFSACGFFPLYPIIASLDNVTYSTHTIWEGELSHQREFHYNDNRQPGRQFILDATDLHEIGDCSYDFLLSSHVLEHLANPLRGLYEWLRILKNDGLLVLVLPHLDGTFDHLRPVTSIEHIISDYQNGITEHDDTHFAEIRLLHDVQQDEGVHSREEFERRITNNYTDRAVHHHTFSTYSTAQLLAYAGVQILSLETIRPCQITIVGRKTSCHGGETNKAFLDRSLPLYRHSPFRTDRGER